MQSAPHPEPHSLWAATAVAATPCFTLKGEKRAKVAIIGGGYTGLSAALHLVENGVDAILLEAGRIGRGASGLNGGQVIPSLKFDPDDVERLYGAALSEQLLKTAGDSADLVFSLIDKYKINCDAQRTGWIQGAPNETMLAVTARRAEQWKQRGASVKVLDEKEIATLVGTDLYIGGWIDFRAGNVQPLSFCRGLANAATHLGAQLHELSPVMSIARRRASWQLQGPCGSVVADQVIIGTNGYTDALWPGLARSIVPLYSMQVATPVLPETIRGNILPGSQTAADTRRLVWYFRRDAHGRFVIGSRGPFKESVELGDTRPLSNVVRQLFPQLADMPFEYWWCGRVAVTKDHLPHLHQLAPGIYAGLGYNGRGVAMATIMGKMLAQFATIGNGEELGLPIVPLKTIPFHAVHRPLVRGLLGYYRLRDRLGW